MDTIYYLIVPILHGWNDLMVVLSELEHVGLLFLDKNMA